MNEAPHPDHVITTREILEELDPLTGLHNRHAMERELERERERFLRHLRPYDSLYRYGGEEFLFCLPDADLKSARKIIERLRLELESRPVEIDRGTEDDEVD